MDADRSGKRREEGGRRWPPRLTPGELAVLSALSDLSDELQYSPTYAQMLERLGWSSKSKGALHQYYERLRRHGVIEGSGRSLRVVDHPPQNDRSEAPFPNDPDSG